MGQWFVQALALFFQREVSCRKQKHILLSYTKLDVSNENECSGCISIVPPSGLLAEETLIFLLVMTVSFQVCSGVCRLHKHSQHVSVVFLSNLRCLCPYSTYKETEARTSGPVSDLRIHTRVF